jgi:hypothetical protein
VPSPIRVLIINADGTNEIREVEQDLPVLQGIVGGYLQHVPAAHDEDGYPAVGIWCDEDGLSKDYPVNRSATALWYTLSPHMAGRDRLCGTVFFTGGADANGDILSLPEPIVQLWQEIQERKE